MDFNENLIKILFQNFFNYNINFIKTMIFLFQLSLIYNYL